ncbi:MAG: hypothetical protein EKK61_05700 [Rickettsiales bacterium]|nr:MAG: hypothetical protein EKK61_05700 [Rickettsiales bacterium]
MSNKINGKSYFKTSDDNREIKISLGRLNFIVEVRYLNSIKTEFYSIKNNEYKSLELLRGVINNIIIEGAVKKKVSTTSPTGDI